ncbi:MAG TPA: peroxidase-related enzyme [Pyrinomonadaceae bacterium]|nr:peroxidase-related enzyme [Pyrinomonadaceae bacterium]
MTYIREAPFNEEDFPTLKLIKEDYGFIPNYFKAQTARPDLIDAQVQLVDGILLKEGALSRQLKEYVFLVCSAANLSTYCVTAHCEIIRMLKIEGPEPEQIALDHMSSDLPIIDKALLNFTLKLNNHPLRVTQDDIDDLKTYGFNDQQILEAVMCVGLAKLANCVGFGLGTVPDYQVRLDLEKSKAVTV